MRLSEWPCFLVHKRQSTNERCHGNARRRLICVRVAVRRERSRARPHARPHTQLMTAQEWAREQASTRSAARFHRADVPISPALWSSSPMDEVLLDGSLMGKACQRHPRR